jgi:hypothetical protein
MLIKEVLTMQNSVLLTDDELAIIKGSLQMNMMNHEQYIEENSDTDHELNEFITQIIKLNNRLNNEFI